MKKKKLTLGVMAVMLLSSTLAVADSDYPAADFQPKVLFHDSEYKPSQPATDAKAGTTEASADVSDPNYPAANFQPQVIFQDEAVSNSQSTEAVASNSSVDESVSADVDDPAYPAANFQPKVLFSDAGAQSKKSAPAAVVKADKANVVAVDSSPASAQPKKEESSDLSLVAMLVVGLIAGFAFFRKNAQAPAVSQSRTHASGTGVSRYLEAVNKNSASGVARYLANLEEKSVTKTGVDKYLRNRS